MWYFKWIVVSIFALRDARCSTSCLGVGGSINTLCACHGALNLYNALVAMNIILQTHLNLVLIFTWRLQSLILHILSSQKWPMYKRLKFEIFKLELQNIDVHIRHRFRCFYISVYWFPLYINVSNLIFCGTEIGSVQFQKNARMHWVCFDQD